MSSEGERRKTKERWYRWSQSKENKEKRKEYRKQWYKENKESLAEKQRENKEHIKEVRARYRDTSRGVYIALKGRIKYGGQSELEISYESFSVWWEQTPKVCCYCGRSVKRANSMEGQSIDRKNPKLSYSLDNIVLSCKRCNTMKGNWLSYEQMLDAAKRYFRDE